MLNFIRQAIPENTYHVVLRAGRSAATFALSALISLIASVIISRELGPEGRGALVWFVSLFALSINIAAFGVGNLNAQLAAEDKKNCPSLILLSVMVALTGTILICPLVYLINSMDPVAVAHKDMLWLTLLIVPFGCFHILILALLLGLRRNRAHVAIIFIEKAFAGILSLAAIYLGYASPFVILCIFYAMYVINVMAEAFFLRQYIKQIFKQGRRALSDAMHKIHHFKKYSFYSYICTLMIVMQDPLVIMFCGFTLGIKQIGIYAAARIMVDSIGTIYSYFSAYTRFQIVSEKNKADKVKVHRHMISFVVFTIIPLVLILSMFSNQIIDFLLGDQFEKSADVFSLLVFACAFVIIGGIFDMYLNANYKNWLIAVTPALRCLVILIAVPLLLDGYGLLGATTGVLLSCAISMTSSMIIYKRIVVR